MVACGLGDETENVQRSLKKGTIRSNGMNQDRLVGRRGGW